MNKIYVLGIGPGTKDYVLPITDRLVREADLLIGGERALALFAEYNKEEMVIKADLAKIKDYIEANYQNQQIAVLVSGDTGLYSMLNYLKRHFSEEVLEVVPGISAMQLGFAKAKLSWQDAKLTSLHGNQDKEELLELLAEYDKIGFFTDNKFPPHQIAEYLTAEGLGDKQGIVAERLSYPEGRVIKGSLAELSEQEFGGLTVMVICDE
ncbi:precorrin-6y C5,15-methyltransferase (decarboxylating) subunit CbiE [Natroniella acetigena]|uniref:precorrin-6y C5,15-methyltransferase (decarboxylating) subunit CbiE n=1 Tax=Natroniella acetigena TaxID=52004 RepID=UPI00200AA234|nr:precorrin-6y C5,15-methyltransferase (decarboxylating) subunit CbiE [Natroniella acetigena]MCK8826470.1 precorrin-6y C5,15-methyltransferase (decarboxylating) subunit CbiE [Natroniella acetigena]